LIIQNPSASGSKGFSLVHFQDFDASAGLAISLQDAWRTMVMLHFNERDTIMLLLAIMQAYTLKNWNTNHDQPEPRFSSFCWWV